MATDQMDSERKKECRKKKGKETNSTYTPLYIQEWGEIEADYKPSKRKQRNQKDTNKAQVKRKAQLKVG